MNISSWLWIIPNLLSLFRIILAPFGAWVLYYKKTPSLGFLSILFVFFITDFLDGYLARRYGWTSNIGKILDPLGDKVMVFSFFTVFFLLGFIKTWFFYMVIGKDILLLFGALSLLFFAKPIPNAEFISKLNTVFQGLFLGSLVLQHFIATKNTYVHSVVLFYGLPFFSLMSTIFSVTLVITTLVSLGIYGQKTYGILWHFPPSLP